MRTRVGVEPAWRPFEMRAYKLLPSAKILGMSVAAAEQSAAGMRLFIERIRRGDELIPATPETILQAGDVLLPTSSLAARSRPAAQL